MAYVTISQRQTPCFRALIAAEDGALFDPETDLATAEELEEEGIAAAPISFSVSRAESEIYYTTTGEASPVSGYHDVEIDASALLDPDVVASDKLDYNFSFVPESRATFPFTSSGVYFVDFTVYPKTGAAIVWRTPIIVK